MSTQVRRIFSPGAAGWRETAVLAVVAWLVPLLVHLIPWTGTRPLGVYLLPVFWTTLVAVYFYGARVGLAVGLVTPLMNLALTGLPAWPMVGTMGLEVAAFALVAAFLVRRWPGFWFAAPVAWVAAKALTIAVQWVLPAFHYADQPWSHLLRSTANGFTGLGMLTVINWLLVSFCPKAGLLEKE
jgi:hypothetical protein